MSIKTLWPNSPLQHVVVCSFTENLALGARSEALGYAEEMAEKNTEFRRRYSPSAQPELKCAGARLHHSILTLGFGVSIQVLVGSPYQG